MQRTTTFTKGSGVYRCNCCSRRTRDDGNGDSVNCRLCTQCFEIAGYENLIQDGGSISPGQYDEIEMMYAHIKACGGDPAAWEMSKFKAAVKE